MHYLLKEHFKHISDADLGTYRGKEDVLSIASVEEARDAVVGLTHPEALLRYIREQPRYTKVEILPQGVMGALIVPDKKQPQRQMVSVYFYFEKKHLLILDRKNELTRTNSYLLSERFTDNADLGFYFFEVFGSLIEGDTQFLREYEARIADLEDRVAGNARLDINQEISLCRKQLLRFDAYYEELIDMFEILISNDNGIFSPLTVSHLRRLMNRTDRLYDTVRSLRSYIYQVREMQQAQINIRQNETMGLLTVVTTIFMPLTLITGWYGMNFSNMPELHKPYSYFILIGICAVIVILEIRYFKKKGWL